MNFSIELESTTDDMAVTLGSAMTLMQSSKKFKDMDFAGDTHVSAINCVHIGSGFKCDLSFDGNVRVFKSNILSHLLSFDKRIRELAMVVKHWMRVYGFVGSDGMSSYDMLWLLFFYLQQLKEAVLPPIDAFQKGIAPIFIGKSNLAFNFTLSTGTRNQQRTLTLLMGFFTFYSKFDFDSQLICPLMGRALRQLDFNAMFPDYFVEQEDDSEAPMDFDQPICIQDPFQKRRALPEKFTIVKFNAMRAAMIRAAEICRKHMCDDGYTNGLLYELFTQHFLDPSMSNVSTVNCIETVIPVVPTTTNLTFDTSNRPNIGTVHRNDEPNRLTFPSTTRVVPVITSASERATTTFLNENYQKMHSLTFVSCVEELRAVKKYLEAVKPSELNGIDCYRVWAQFNLHFVAETLAKMLQLQPIDTDILLHEKNSLSKKFSMPSFQAICHLWVDHTDFKSIIIDFYGNVQNAKVHQHQKEFLNRLQKSLLPPLIRPYFDNLYAYTLFNPTADMCKPVHIASSPVYRDVNIRHLRTDTTCSMNVEPNELTLSAVEQYLEACKSPLVELGDAYLRIRRVWAPFCIQFIIDVLVNVLSFELFENHVRPFPNTDYSKSFEVIGKYDVGFGRKSVRKRVNDIRDGLNLEFVTTLESLTTVKRRTEHPIRAIFHIWSNPVKCDKVTIDVINLMQTPLHDAWKQVEIRVPRMVDAYFEKLRNNELILNFVSIVHENGVAGDMTMPSTSHSHGTEWSGHTSKGKTSNIKSRLS